jgi:hypothetical protein
MVHARSNGRKQDNRRAATALSVNDFQSFLQRFGHHHHARSATERPIVNTAIVALGYVPRVEQTNVYRPGTEGPTRDTASQKRCEKLWEKGDYIEAHRLDDQ